MKREGIGTLSVTNNWGLPDSFIHSSILSYILRWFKDAVSNLDLYSVEWDGKTVMNSEYEIETRRSCFLSMISVSAVESVFRSLHQSVNNSHLLSHDPAIVRCPGQKNIHPISRLENLLWERVPKLWIIFEKIILFVHGNFELQRHWSLPSWLLIYYHKYYQKRNLEECDMEENMEASKVMKTPYL
jgi:hypothetical protein